MNIHLFVGLPGSGKSFLAKELFQTLPHSIFIDDLFIQLRLHDFNWNTLFQEALTNSFITDIIITDFLACQPEQQIILFNKLNTLFNSSIQYWHFFDNNKEQCLHNVNYRNDGRKVHITIESMHKEYSINDFILQHAQVSYIPVYSHF